MTIYDSLRAIRRRWYACASALLLAGALIAVFSADSGVYSTRTVVAFTYPHESSLTPDNATSNESVIAFAGAVVAAINAEAPSLRYSASDAPFYGAGLREGVAVGLQDEGSQWAPSFGHAVIEIRIVGATEAWVREQQAANLEAVAMSSSAMQDELAIAPEDRITARVEPLTMTIQHITASRMAQAAAVGAMLLAGAITGAWASISLDHAGRKRLAAAGEQVLP
ncbi:hypothetical protein [Agrococcus sp. TF02-05]|uniref:hypothetical protein n=1 Tax=Agrococcus sp. TF02-05 TaxID=2815211 RepID=UPI001AA1B18C|nr:hypothetical protein [Agrococcus sp. TF02-05]MBO1769112.1 hypothetical protein [Agrococcus sp. TF02-05]